MLARSHIRPYLPGGAANDQNFGFAYTAASQISQRTASNDNFNWTGSNVSRGYNRNGLNQYTSTTGTGAASFNYDARGNFTNDGSRRFCYDLENRLTAIAPAATDPCVTASTMALAYDPLGRLRQTSASGVTTDFLYDGDRLVAEYNGATLLRRYVHGPGFDEPLIWYEGSSTSDRRALIADHQGSVIAASGATTARYSYGPYGEPNVWSGSRFRYTGQIILDPDLNTTTPIGFYHYKARVYWPDGGRFLQTDPVGYEDDLNLYAYVRNDPLNLRDPSGAITISVGFEGEATVFFGVSGGAGAAVSFPVPFVDPDAEFDAGIYGFVSGRAGKLVGLGPAIGIGGGSVQDMRGMTADATVAYGLGVSVQAPITEEGVGSPEVGGAAPIGPQMSLEGVSDVRIKGIDAGASVGARATAAGTIRDAVSAMTEGDRSAQNPPPQQPQTDNRFRTGGRYH